VKLYLNSSCALMEWCLIKHYGNFKKDLVNYSCISVELCLILVMGLSDYIRGLGW
jgi:hypothetical protein